MIIYGILQPVFLNDFNDQYLCYNLYLNVSPDMDLE